MPEKPSELERWGRVLQEVLAEERLWEPEELGAVWRHELEAPILFEWAKLDSDSPARDPSPIPGETSSGAPIRSYRDLLHHPTPPLELLIKTKEYAKANETLASRLLPREICTVLYLAAIVVADVRLNTRIARVTQTKIRSGIEWALAEDWLDDQTKGLFRAWVDLRFDTKMNA